MLSSDRIVKFETQTDEIYRAIGKFAVQFEQVVFSLRQGITFFLSKNGLQNQQLSNIMLSELTAYPMKSIFSSMVPEILELNDKENKILNTILKRIQNLIDLRNNIIHSTWFIGYANPEDLDFSEASGHKLTRNKAGAGVKNFKYKSEDFDKLSEECLAVSSLINRFWGVIISDRKIEENFLLSDTGDVSELKRSEQMS